MKFINKITLIALVLLFGCADEDLKPILSFEDSGKGAYVKLVEESDKLINVFDESTINSSSYTYSVEFVDINGGNKITEYRVDLVYQPVSGSEQTASSFKSFSQSDFSDSPNGLRSLSGITITAPEMLQALGLQPSDLAPGDNFLFEGFVILDDGQTFGFDNSSAPVRGAAFGGHFNFTLPAACPSDLTGTFEFETTDIWCDGSTATGTVDIEARGGGVYEFSDWAFGAYGPCYGGGTAGGEILFTDVCTEVSFTGFTDSFGDTWTFTSSIEGNEWTIQWTNTYGEAATSVVKYTGGADWPITLK